MNDIEKNRVDEIVTLHNEVAGYLRMSLSKAIRIGELLTEQKAALKHGKFLPWIEANLPFTARTARNYMAVYSNRNLLKTESVSDLSSAYRLLGGASHTEEPKDRDLKPGDPDYLEQFWLRHRQRRHKIVDLKCDLDIADTMPELQRIIKEVTVLQQESAEELLYIERHLGHILNELKAQIPEIKKLLADGPGYIEDYKTLLAGPLPDDVRQELENASREMAEALPCLKYGLALVA